MKCKNKIILLSTSIFLILITLILITYGYYLTKIKGNTNDKSVTASIAYLELTYNDGNGLISANNIIPGENITTKTFSVENTGNKKVVNYVVYLEDVINTFEDKNDLKLTLNCTSSINSNCMGNNMIYPDNDTLLVLNDIDVGEIQTYELKVDFIETHDDQSDNMNKIIEGNIVINDLKGTENSLEIVSGTDNVMLDNLKQIIDYKIYGNSVQDGTPTPDNPIEIESVGDKTNNLFDKSRVTLNARLYTTDVELHYDDIAKDFFTSEFIEVEPNTEYYYSKMGKNYITRLIMTDSNKNFIKNIDSNDNLIIKTTNNTKYIIFNGLKSEIDEFMLSKSSNIIAYEPFGYKIPIKVNDNVTNIYLDEPLRKIGDYADYIDFENSKVVRQIKETFLDGVTTNKKIEQFNLYPSNNLYYAVVTGTNGVNGFADVVLNTHFTPASGVVKGHCYITSHGKFHVMVHTNQELNTIALWNAWLQEQYNNGTPVIFHYALAEEIPEDIVLPSILLNEGTNIIEVDTTISPSKIDIEYLK